MISAKPNAAFQQYMAARHGHIKTFWFCCVPGATKTVSSTWQPMWQGWQAAFALAGHESDLERASYKAVPAGEHDAM